MSDAEKKCHAKHNIVALSFFSLTVSIILLIATSILNSLFIIALTRNKRLLKDFIFYKLLLNIAVADLLTAIISDSTSISFYIKEGLGQYISRGELKTMHCGLFFINGASIFTMAFLCIDRIVALLKPITYRNGMSMSKSILLISTIWLLSGLVIIPYFYIDYVRYLTVFSFTTVTFTTISLVGVAIIYTKRLKPTAYISRPNSADENRMRVGSNVNQLVSFQVKDEAVKSPQMKQHMKSSDNMKDADLNKQTSNNSVKPDIIPAEKRVNTSFVLMLVVFLLTYIPAVIMTLYMNLCVKCHCTVIHSLRDLTYLSIVSSAVWRPLNFIIRLKTIRKTVATLIRKIYVPGNNQVAPV